MVGYRPWLVVWNPLSLDPSDGVFWSFFGVFGRFGLAALLRLPRLIVATALWWQALFVGLAVA